MKFFLDTANLDELRKGADWGVVDGVTRDRYARSTACQSER